MLFQRRFFWTCVALFILIAAPVYAAWEPVADGIEYQYFRIEADPNDVFVARMDRSNPTCIIESSIGQGQLRSGRETVSGMAARYDDAINYWGESWGQRNDVIAAINGDYFNVTTGYPTSGQIHSGWFCKGYLEYSGGSGFVWKLSRDCFLGGNVTNGDQYANPKQQVDFAGGATLDIRRVNSARGADELILYTPQWADRTYTTDDGTEVLVQLTRPNLLEAAVTGTIREVRRNAGSTPIPFDSVVLSGQGAAAQSLNNQATVGRQVTLRMRIRDYDSGNDWSKAYAGIGGHFYCVKNGIVPSADWEDNPGATARHPRTCVAITAGHVYFIVVDGRSARSAGMNITELGNFCVGYLGAQWAIAQDGGGSSTLVVNGLVKNRPSDGTERPVANGYLMVRVLPKVASDRLQAGTPVTTAASAELRLGPGANYGSVATAPAGGEGTVVVHTLNGVYAKGEYWWKWNYQGVEGWSIEGDLGVPNPDARNLWGVR